jgi:transposase
MARYRFRLYPGPAQQEMLARTFGCARVVFNDCLRLRDELHAAGEKVSDTEVQRRVITLAKTTPERAWLAGVASVALVQACQDARRAYRNWFDSLSGKRKGRRAGHPRFRSRKDRRQSVRFTRNGFALHGERLCIAKVGDVRVRWSRPLPSVPSSVTIIREADGRYYASFVVQVAPGPPGCGLRPPGRHHPHRSPPVRPGHRHPHRVTPGPTPSNRHALALLSGQRTAAELADRGLQISGDTSVLPRILPPPAAT